MARPTVRQATAAVQDWAYAIPQWLGSVATAARPDSLAAPTTRCGAPVLLLPGVLNNWRFQRPLAEALIDRGHPVHLVGELGLNTHSLEWAADTVASFIRRRGLTGLVIVAHSKGGLIGKLLLSHPGVADRLHGMVALATPFEGTPLARIAPRWSTLSMFRPGATPLARLGRTSEVNQRIVSIVPTWDEMVLDGCRLPGAVEVTLDGLGHFRPFISSAAHDMIHTYVHQLSDPAGGAEPCK